MNPFFTSFNYLSSPDLLQFYPLFDTAIRMLNFMT